MLVKSGRLVPDCDGKVDKQQTLAAMEGLFPKRIADATADDNFKGEKCDSCPHRINPFEMNTINGLKFSPKGGPHEHYRSTGIRDGSPGRFGAAEGECARGVWDLKAITCMADFWDRDPGCTNGPTSNDVDTKKRPTSTSNDVEKGPCCDGIGKEECVCSVFTPTSLPYRHLVAGAE